MGEPIWTTVTVKWPARWNPPSATRGYPMTPPSPISDFRDYYALCNGDATYDDDEWTITGEANYGLEDDALGSVLDELCRRGIPWHAHAEAKYDMLAAVRFYNGHGDIHSFYGADLDGDIVLTRSEWRSIIGRARSRSRHWPEVAVGLVDEFFKSACWQPVELTGAFPPPDAEEALTFDEAEIAGVDPTLRDR